MVSPFMCEEQQKEQTNIAAALKPFEN